MALPEFKEFMKEYMMKETYDILNSSSEENRFHTISESKWCMHDGGEVKFEYRGKHFSIIHPEEGILIGEIYKPETRKICSDSDEILEYLIDGVRQEQAKSKPSSPSFSSSFSDAYPCCCLSRCPKVVQNQILA